MHNLEFKTSRNQYRMVPQKPIVSTDGVEASPAFPCPAWLPSRVSSHSIHPVVSKVANALELSRERLSEKKKVSVGRSEFRRSHRHPRPWLACISRAADPSSSGLPS
jgi:hypothetical protein